MKIDRKSTPRPSTHANTVPITTSSARARSPAAPMPRATEHAGGEQADAHVDADRGGGERAGERDVAERVAREHLRAQHHEVADEPAGQRDERAGEEGVAHERVREHQRACEVAPHRGAAT